MFDPDQNLAPAIRYTLTGVILALTIPALLIMKLNARHGEGLGILLVMALVGLIAVILIVNLNNERAKNKVIKLPKLPKKRDTFIS